MVSVVALEERICHKPQDNVLHVRMPIVYPVMSTPVVLVLLVTIPLDLPVYLVLITVSPVSMGSPVGCASHPTSSPMLHVPSSVAVSMEVSHHQVQSLPVILDAASVR